MNGVIRGVLVLALALPLALFWHTWASANPSHFHYTTGGHINHYAGEGCNRPVTVEGTCYLRNVGTPQITHYVNLAPYATPGEVGIALLGVALALSLVARQRKALAADLGLDD
jgi:hypothetical protein